MKVKVIIIIGILSLMLGFMGGCNSVENSSNSATRLIIQLITGNDLEGNVGSTTIFSDVLREGSVFNDNGAVVLRAELINPMAETSTYYQTVIVDQIDVEYSRADGLSVEGKDVPYSFSQKVHAIVNIGEETEIGFVIIQHVAKEEPPLVQLINMGQEHVLKLEAKVTVHSKDLGDNRLAPVSGSVSVWCADFGDA